MQTNMTLVSSGDFDFRNCASWRLEVQRRALRAFRRTLEVLVVEQQSGSLRKDSAILQARTMLYTPASSK